MILRSIASFCAPSDLPRVAPPPAVWRRLQSMADGRTPKLSFGLSVTPTAQAYRGLAAAPKEPWRECSRRATHEQTHRSPRPVTRRSRRLHGHVGAGNTNAALGNTNAALGNTNAAVGHTAAVGLTPGIRVEHDR